MSTHQTHYVMLGNRYDYNDFYSRVQKRVATNPRDAAAELEQWREDVEEKHMDTSADGINNHNGICIVSDGMNSEYVYVGYVLAKSGDGNDLGDYTAQWHSNWDDIGDNIVRAVGFAEDVQIHAFTHYR